MKRAGTRNMCFFYLALSQKRRVGPIMVSAFIFGSRDQSSSPRARFSKTPETFRARKAMAKSRTLLRLKGCFIHIFFI